MINIPVWLVILLVCVCYIILPFIVWSCIRNEKAKRIITIFLLVVYLAILVCCIIGSYVIDDGNVVFGFDFSGEWVNKPINWNFNGLDGVDAIINIVMLIPVGMAMQYLTKKKNVGIRLVVIIGVAVISGFFLEALQFILPIYRAVQLSDVIFNAISVVIGAVLAWLYIILIKKIQGVGRKNQAAEAEQQQRVEIEQEKLKKQKQQNK